MKDRMEIVLLLILGGFTAAFLFESRQYGEMAAFLPRLVSVASLVLLALALAVQIFRKAKSGGREGEAPAAWAADAVPWPAALATQVGSIVLIFFVGFPVATLIYLLVAPFQMHYRRWKIMVPFAFLLTAVTVASFTHLFSVRFPGGLLWTALSLGGTR